MKKAIFSLLLIASSLNSMASSLEVTCQVGDDKIVVTASLGNERETQTLSIFNQGGSGPNNLEASFVATSGFYQFSPSDTVFVTYDFPMGGKFQVEFLDTYGEEDGSGVMTYPNAKSVTALKNCRFKII